MNKRKNQRFVRKSRGLTLKKLVIVITEGAVTERQYIGIVNKHFQSERQRRSSEKPNVSVTIVPHGDKSSPNHLLRRLRKEISENNLDDNYSAWLICDRDQWTSEQFKEVQDWVEKDPDRNHWVLSAPKFEHWLSLHFENQEDDKLFFARFKKSVQPSDFCYEQIRSACKKARQSYQNNADLFVHDGSQMFQFIEFLAKEYGLESDFT